VELLEGTVDNPQKADDSQRKLSRAATKAFQGCGRKFLKVRGSFRKLRDRLTLRTRALEGCGKSFRKLCGKLGETELNSNTV